MSERAPYSRVYWTIRADDRLCGIYPNDRHLATWVRLLLAADMAWPAPADLPTSASKASLAALVSAGVIEILPGGLFSFHGLAAERGRRRVAATRKRLGQDPGGLDDDDNDAPGRVPVAPRPGPKRDPDGRTMRDPDGRTMPGRSLAEPSRAEPRRAETPAREGLPHLTDSVAAAWSDATGVSLLGSGEYAANLIDDACRRHPEATVAAAIATAREEFAFVPSTQALATAVRNRLDPLPTGGKAAESDQERAAREIGERQAARVAARQAGAAR